MDKAVEKIAGFECCYVSCGDVAYTCKEQQICAAYRMKAHGRHFLKKATHIKQILLSDPDIPICEYDPDAELPNPQISIEKARSHLGWGTVRAEIYNYQNVVRKAGWVKKK